MPATVLTVGRRLWRFPILDNRHGNCERRCQNGGGRNTDWRMSTVRCPCCLSHFAAGNCFRAKCCFRGNYCRGNCCLGVLNFGAVGAGGCVVDLGRPRRCWHTWALEMSAYSLKMGAAPPSLVRNPRLFPRWLRPRKQVLPCRRVSCTTVPTTRPLKKRRRRQLLRCPREYSCLLSRWREC